MAPKIPKSYRIPKDASPEVAELADYFLRRIVDVAEGKVHSKRATSVLKAAVEGRKELCGPIAQKVDVDIKGRLEHLLTQSMDEPPALPPASPNVIEGEVTEVTPPSPSDPID